MYALDRAAWEVLNATADDWENLEQILHLVNDSGQVETTGCALEIVAERIRTLVEQGMLSARLADQTEPMKEFLDLSYVWRAWFAMTPEGRTAWLNSDWMPAPSSPPAEVSA